MPHLAIRSKELGTTSPRGVWLAWCFWASSYSSSFASTGLGTEKTTHSLAIEPYAYPASPSGGNVPKLASIADPSGNASERFFFDDAGNETYRATQTAKHRLSYDALGRMSQIKTDSDETAGALVTLAYDGRSFLRQAARSPFPGQPATVTTRPTYSSDGLLMHKETTAVLGPEDPRGEGTVASDAYVLYFAGRPVGILENETLTPLGGGTTSSSTLTYLTTDHLGTPVLATDASGASTWSGGFEPFGDDWQAQAGTGASEAGVFLRFPGQWDDAAWGGAGEGEARASDPGLYYNVHRWYEYGTGRYGRVDPAFAATERGVQHPFSYSEGNSVLRVDPLGLASFHAGAGGRGNVAFPGGGASSGVAFDTAGNFCFYFRKCFMWGWNTVVGGALGGSFGGGTGFLCSGTQISHGLYFFAAGGPAFQGQVLVGKGGVSGGRGFGGVGAGAGLGYMRCETRYECFFDDPCRCE